MMYEDFAVKMAKVITEYSQPVQPGDVVLVQSNTLAEPLSRALYEAILRRGGHPTVFTQLPGLGELFMEIATEEQLAFVDPFSQAMIDIASKYYNVMAEVNPKAGTAANPERIAIAQNASRHMVERFFQRLADESLGWVLMPYPTHAMAQAAETSLLAYTKFVYEACAFHLDDPVAYWQTVHERQQKLVDVLNTKQELHIIGPDIDLTMRVGGRLWINCDGTNNFPDGEIFTGPLEDSVNGYVNFNLRTVYGAREVNGVRLRYENGVIVEADAAKGKDWLMSQLDLDDGARRMGEFAIGTNYNIKDVTGNTLFDEKIGGTIHMAIGRSIPESLGQNISSVHWDMVHDMANGEIYADGELIYQHGQFTIAF